MVVIGTRPQIIKASVLLGALARFGIGSVLVHTGQHFDTELSEVFFRELGLRHPDYNLATGSGGDKHQIQVGVHRLVLAIMEERPDLILTIGDSDPALVGCLGAIVEEVALGHIEAGLRSGNSAEPEERNRTVIDGAADWLFCSTDECLQNCLRERAAGNALRTGDLLKDAWIRYGQLVDIARPKLPTSAIHGDFCLFTLHRRGNAYDPRQLSLIVDMLAGNWSVPTVWPVHPGVHEQLEKLGHLDSLQRNRNVVLAPPATYLEMRWLEQNCRVVVTDSVGVQVEAYLAGKPSVVLRHEVEYASLVRSGWTTLVHPTREGLASCAEVVLGLGSSRINGYDEHLFGDGNAAIKIASALAQERSR
jgi:UDP-GlcNAc3NAcA epimerase